MEILNIKNLSFAYPLCNTQAIKNVSFTVNKGEFITLCGATGSGKSTLLRLIKKELAPLGEIQGNIYYCGKPLEELSAKESAGSIGFVMQKPEQQIVTDKVWHELAFGLENLNTPQSTIARRVAEMAVYFGIEDWYDKKVSELSGGQKQLLNLAAVMAMQPEILILDEPTAQLDPIAASDFIATLKKLNREFALTVIITEHRLEEIVPVSDKLLVLNKGEVLSFDTPQRVIENIKGNAPLMCAMPSSARLYHMLCGKDECPLDVRQGRNFIESSFDNKIKSLPQSPYNHSKDVAIEFKDVRFRYDRNTPDVLSGTNLTVYHNEIFFILGGNGSGKTTTLSAAAGLLKIYSGSIRVFGKKLKDYKNQSLYRDCLALLPQDVQTVFLKNTVAEELADAKVEAESLPFDISHLYDKHPYDLSGGEQQLVALAKILATKPKLLLLDEPTKGLDANAKQGFIKILKELKAKGTTVVVVSHDVEFAALCADRCAMFFHGDIVAVSEPKQFFSENSFYTTAINRMTKGYYENAVTIDDAIRLCEQNGTKGGEA